MLPSIAVRAPAWSTRPAPVRGPGMAGLAMEGTPSLRLPGEHFAAALFFLCTGSIGLVWIAPELAAGLYLSPHVAGVTHCFTLGWLSMTIFGAMYQLLPVALGVSISSERAGHVSFWTFAPGVALFASGVAFSSGTLRNSGIALIAVGVTCLIVNVALSLRRVVDRNVIWGAFVIALSFLTVTFAMGALLARNLHTGFLGDWRVTILATHLHVALIGWVLVMIAGISHRLLPMFLLAHSADTRWTLRALALLAPGVVILALGILAGHSLRPDFVAWAGLLLIESGIFCFLTQAWCFFRARKRPRLDAGLRHAATALVSSQRVPRSRQSFCTRVDLPPARYGLRNAGTARRPDTLRDRTVLQDRAVPHVDGALPGEHGEDTGSNRGAAVLSARRAYGPRAFRRRNPVAGNRRYNRHCPGSASCSMSVRRRCRVVREPDCSSDIRHVVQGYRHEDWSTHNREDIPMNTNATPVQASDKLQRLFERDERLIDVVAGHSPQLAKLRHSPMRRIMARVTTVAQAARLCNMSADSLVRELNHAIGIHSLSSDAANADVTDAIEKSAAVQWSVPSSVSVVDLDVREELSKGGEPFSRIMAAVGTLREREVLHLRAPFEPVPLFAVMQKRGFAHRCERHADHDWSVWSSSRDGN